MIRPANLADIEVLVNLDHSYLTDHVWQMAANEAPRDAARGRLTEYASVFRLSALPRQLKVPASFDARGLRRILNRCDYAWVRQGEDSGDLYGYLGMAVSPWQNTGWVPVVCVRPDQRRRGVATQLLSYAIAQARELGLRTVTLDVSTKNYPATRLAQSRGFRYAGFADNYGNGQDLAMFYAHRVR
ncbi:MAG: GNAT family N-acetyltransferase [Thermoflexales bacterium]|nr:GNAT family N-acetyltransferase [Thermoflexales bacterium]